ARASGQKPGPPALEHQRAETYRALSLSKGGHKTPHFWPRDRTRLPRSTCERAARSVSDLAEGPDKAVVWRPRKTPVPAPEPHRPKSAARAPSHRPTAAPARAGLASSGPSTRACYADEQQIMGDLRPDGPDNESHVRNNRTALPGRHGAFLSVCAEHDRAGA